MKLNFQSTQCFKDEIKKKKPILEKGPKAKKMRIKKIRTKIGIKTK
jgi:TATA-binding protein-associated factor Taf7